MKGVLALQLEHAGAKALDQITELAELRLVLQPSPPAAVFRLATRPCRRKNKGRPAFARRARRRLKISPDLKIGVPL
jgi:hypothetical protein